MIRKLLSFAIMVSTTLSLTSCLKDNDDKVTYYDDTAVTAFSLGTLNRYIHTTARDGVTDSIYKASYSAATYVFYIDQAQKLIYNPDSLPYGTDQSKVITNITTKNSGIVVLNLQDKEGKDSLARYATTDSIDYTKPVRVRVYNMRNTAYREYTVTVNVHQQTGDEVNWGTMTQSALATVGARKFVNNNGQMYLFGQKNNQTVVFKKNGTGFAELSQTLSAEAYKNVVATSGYIFVLDNGSIKRSADGQTWEEMAAAPTLTQLVGAGNANLYAIGNGGIMVSADNGSTWTVSQMDDNTNNLPTENINFATFVSKTNEQTNTLILAGTRNGETKIWSKIEENSNNSQNQPWAFYNKDTYNRHTLQALANLQVIAYGENLMAWGGDFSTVYVSQDQGLTWFADSKYKLDDSFGKTETPFAVGCDNTNTIYISKSGSDEIRTCRLARMAWAENQKAFIK